jgi:hypothetical protein
MRTFALALVALALVVLSLACAKPHERKLAPATDVEPVPPGRPPPTTTTTTTTTTTPPAPVATAASAPRTKLVSHMVNGRVEIEEVPIVDEPPAPAVIDAHAAPATAPTTATTTPAARDPLPPPPAASKDVIERANEETNPEKRIALLETAAQELEKTKASPATRAAVFAAMGEVYEQQNDGPHAEFAYRDAADLVPAYRHRYEDVKRKNSVERYYTHQESEHFVARFEGSEDDDLAHRSLTSLDEAYKTVGGKIDLYPPQPVTVVFYTSEQYKDAVYAPDWSGGLFDGKIRIPKGARSDVGDVLKHEYTHAVLHTLPSAVPTWFNEGLAQWMEDHRSRNVIDRMKQAGGRKLLPSLAQLRQSFGRLDAKQARVAYACALDLVDFFVEQKGDYSLRDLVGKMKSGSSFDDAVHEVYGLTQDQLEEQWRERFHE